MRVKVINFYSILVIDKLLCVSLHSLISLQSPCSVCYLMKEGSRNESKLRKERKREKERGYNKKQIHSKTNSESHWFIL